MSTEKKLSFSDNVVVMEPKDGTNGTNSSHKAEGQKSPGTGGGGVTNSRSPQGLERPSEGYFASKHHHKSSKHSHNSNTSRTPSGTYAPVRTPNTPGGTVRDPQQAQYLAQERAYLQKIRNDLWDDYYARGLSPVSSVDTMESESDDEDNEEDDNQNVGVGLGGVGTSFDDEYTDLGSSYPFLEASYEDFDNPEHLKERLEWQAMLSSVLTGEVVRSEKRRLKAPTNDNKLQEDDLWIGIRAKVCGRTVAEQKRVLDYARANVNDVLEEFLNFRISYKNDDASLESASEQVEEMIEKIEKCESLWRSKLAMRQENKIYGSEEFQRRMEALISWNTITHSINKELDLLRKWTGNNDLDPTRPPDTSGSSNDAMDEKSSLVENILKQDDLTQVFDLRIKQSIGPLIQKAREATVEYSEVFVDLGLPLFHERLSHLMSFPIKLIQEIIRMRLIYARRLVNPTMMIVDQTISDFQLYIQIGLSIMENNRMYTDPIFDKGWVFPNHVDETFNSTVLDCMRFYLELLHSKYLDSVKVYKSYQTFKETEQLEQQYNFLKDIGRLITGGDILVAEQFSSLESKMLARLLGYWEQQMKGPNTKNPAEVERWFASAIENVRSFQRKLLRFYRILRNTYENCTEVSIQTSKVKSYGEALRKSSHFLVYTGAFEKYGIYAIADPSLKNQPERIKQILMGYSRCAPVIDETSNQPRHVSYVTIWCIQEPLVWEGDIVNMEIPYFDMELKPGRMRLVSEGGTQELRQAREYLAAVTGGADVFDVAIEAKSHLTKVHHEVLKVRKLLFKLSSAVINSAIQFRARCRDNIPNCQETVHNMFVFAREFGQRGINVMDASRRGAVAMKLINLCIDWVSFICDDCAPTDYRTFRWTVVALEFAMVMTRGVNIVAISNEQFSKLKLKVAGCMTLLISHFDIMGARSKAAEQRRSQEAARRNKLQNVQIKDDDELMQVFRNEAFKKICQLEEARQQQHVVGKVLDEKNTDTEFLMFLASSFSKVSIRWQQGRFIGGGSFGTVYAAVNLDTGGVMAVKEIRLQDTQSIRHVLKSIKDEMTVLEILNHPNIVQYYGVEVHRDKVFIFMEYCQGGSLAGLLEYGRIEDEQVIQVYTLQMLEGLAYLHQSGIVHRDIKPENILLDHMGVVKFVDFGAAKVIARTGKTKGLNNGRTKLNSMTGTPMYMSPEVITGSDPGRQGSIDIWSLGCCVLEMATGRRPWANLDNEWAIMYHIAAGHLPQLPSRDQLSEEGHNFLMKCLQRDPTNRPSAIELLNDPWIVKIRNAVLEPAANVVSPDGAAAASSLSNSYQQNSLTATTSSTRGEWIPSVVARSSSSGGSIGFQVQPQGWQLPSSGGLTPSSASASASASVSGNVSNTTTESGTKPISESAENGSVHEPQNANDNET